MRVLNLNTVHLSRAAVEWLDLRFIRNDEGLWVGKYAYGWVMPADDDDSFLDIPSALREISIFACKHKCDRIMFDADGSVVEGLPTYPADWQ